MKRVIRAAQQSSYEDFMTIHHGRQKFGVHIDVSDSPKDNNWGPPRFSMSEIHPYDDGDYAWCKRDDSSSLRVDFFRNGKKLDSMNLWSYESDDYENYTDYIDDVLDQVAIELMDVNKDVKPRMVHN